MRAVWPIFLGCICTIQVMLAIYALFGLMTHFEVEKILLFKTIVLGFAIPVPIFTGSILVNNFPDKIIAGPRRKIFNILCIASILLIPFLCVYVLKVYEQTPSYSKIAAMRFITQRQRALWDLLFSIGILTCHLIILFGLFLLKSFINSNARNKSLWPAPFFAAGKTSQ